jgi:hypothetical protein
MKTIAMLILLALSSTALANGTCPNLNGVFKVNETSAIRLTQNGCVSLSLAWGEFEENGKIRWMKSTSKAILNGPATCTVFGCVTGKTSPEQIEMSRDTGWTQQNEHGVCGYNHVSYSLDAQGNLVGKHNVNSCQDGFVGLVEVVLPRIN